jgi:ParB-like chromosome segregation protein Spo0J
MSPKSQSLQMQYLAIDTVAFADVNPKQHQLEEIKNSLMRFGFVAPAVLNGSTNKLVAGHGRICALRELHAAGSPPPDRIQVGKDGKWSVPVVVVPFASDSAAQAYLVADNRLTEQGGWDAEMLLNVLSELATGGEDALVGVGWSVDEINALLVDSAEAPAKPEEAEQSTEAERYMAATVKQLVFYFNSAQYDVVVERLEVLMAENSLGSHSIALLHLLGITEEAVTDADAEAEDTESAEQD